MTILDPDRCKSCGRKGRVVDSRRGRGYRRRRHVCRTCVDAKGKPRAWTSYQSRLSPVPALRRWLQHVTT